MSLGNCKLKQQWDTTIHLLEWLKSKTLTTPNADNDVEQQELSFIVDGLQNGTTTLEDSLAVSYKTKHTIRQLNCICPKELNLHPHKNLHVDFYRSLIHSCQNLEAIKIFFCR